MNEQKKEIRILIVDDDPFVLKLLGHQLTHLGFKEIVACLGAEEALSHFDIEQAHGISLVISDLQMPGMDGIEFVRHLVARDYTGGLLLLSGEEERTIQAASRLIKTRHLQLLGTLKKPVDLDTLRRHLSVIAPLAAKQTRPSRKLYPPDQIKRAITQGELVLHYQPKVALATGAWVGVESLVRWNHPEDGLIFPDQFISVAEEHALIDALTHRVLVESLHQAVRWKKKGLALKVAVNISMENLHALDFPDVVTQALRETGAGAESLVLEVTESRLMQGITAPLDTLTRLRLKRVTLSIDDFGTGHSSLAQLRDLPFDEMKLDRGFVHGVHRDPQRRVILEASIGMARQLGMHTVAEGVEDRDDWDILRDLGCDLAQGYFCARPMADSALIEWFRGWMTRKALLTGGN
jgi:EAL domain-containing protein (putative c-di-GMP-specific phosphodiesterase class I)/FixJ family two-component response regulator